MPRFPADPRIWQITLLTVLLAYGTTVLGFDIVPLHAGLLVVTALATQYACTRIWQLPAFDPKSALITSLSLCLLLRVDAAWGAVLAAWVGVASKFLLRRNGKHVFNPSNFALCVLLASGAGWVSPGQWGNAAFLVFLFGCVGALVVYRAERSDVTLAFFAFYAALVFGRSFWLGEPTTIPIHRLQSGGLLLFGFFMISDPKSTPDSRAGRVLFAGVVAFGAWWVQAMLFRNNGLQWALLAVSAFTPLLDWLFRGRRYEWPTSLPSTRPSWRTA